MFVDVPRIRGLSGAVFFFVTWPTTVWSGQYVVGTDLPQQRLAGVDGHLGPRPLANR